MTDEDWADGVRRRPRRRAGVAVAAGTAVVIATAVAVSALPGRGADQGHTPKPPAVTETAEVRTAFTCPLESRVFGELPPIPDLAGQQRIVARLATLDSIDVRHAEPTALGVVALVADDSGDRDFYADPEVVDRLRRLGVAYVYEWDPVVTVSQVLGWVLDPVVRQVRAAARGIPGSAGIALWQAAGAVLLQWKAPLPPAVAALDGATYDGVRVIVEPVTYSDADVRAAQRRLVRWLGASGHRDQLASTRACADHSGLVVGMVPPVDAGATLADEMSDAVGMPVRIVAEDRPIDLMAAR